MNLSKVHFQKDTELILWNLKLKFWDKKVKTFFSNFVQKKNTFIWVLDFMLLSSKLKLRFWPKNKVLGKLVVGRVMGYARHWEWHEMHGLCTRCARLRGARQVLRAWGMCETPISMRNHVRHATCLRLRSAWTCLVRTAKTCHPLPARKHVSRYIFGVFWPFLKIISALLVFSWLKKVKWMILPYIQVNKRSNKFIDQGL